MSAPRHKTNRWWLLSALAALAAGLILALAPNPARAQDKTKGQTLYVPAYSHVYEGAKNRPFMLTVTLSVRNLDPARTITLTSVKYLDDRGKPVREYLAGPVDLGPLGTAEYLVGERDDTGGSGAKFLVTWRSEAPAHPPLVESVMIGTYSNAGISFVCRGIEIEPPK